MTKLPLSSSSQHAGPVSQRAGSLAHEASGSAHRKASGPAARRKKIEVVTATHGQSPTPAHAQASPGSAAQTALHPMHLGTTIERFLLEKQRALGIGTGDFTGLLQQIALAAKIIAAEVRRASLAGNLGLTGGENIHGERIQKLDQIAHDTLVRCVERGGHCCVLGSEESDDIVPVAMDTRPGKYVLLFDPLDGSGNLDVNAATGTIFSVFRRKTAEGAGTLEDCLRAGSEMVAAGYAVYGSSTMLVYTDGAGVHGFTLDPSIGEFLLSHPDIRVPERGTIYAVNEGNGARWHAWTRQWLQQAKDEGRAKALRYSGAMVADVHRVLLQGGIFAYPGEVQKPRGKLRLLYEAAPMAFVMETAGGLASNGDMPIATVIPDELHARTPLFIGSKLEVRAVLAAKEAAGH